ncbi:hypothetical protein UFOVP639_30 [uncultured Caudovirales phage]|uniref:Uncharacterized protein n=1 Tax=uncultured Caudovirales phage TaxID=2100421 RepID=A0A6J5N5U9_9CAUD|nr:hypothetical protein UFOVP639_30 [uncultured Caudovirales phage]
MVIEISDKMKKIINDMPYNKTVKMNAIKIYGALYMLSHRKNKFGYFSVPSEYLKSINVRYYKIIDHFESSGAIAAYTRPVQDENDIFEIKNKKYYDKSKGICMKYRFLIPTDGQSLDINMTTNRRFRWYETIQNSLIEHGYDNVKITRDSFGRRVFHSGIRDYKKDFIGFYCIDAVASQPSLLYMDMKEKEIIDTEYMDIFDNDKDFYLELQYKLKLESKEDAKDLFMHWVNGRGYVPNFNIHTLFPVASAYIKKYKSSSYKDMASHLQRVESKIWVDNIMNDIPTDWAIPIHDSVIIKKEDSQAVYSFIKSRYPDLKIKMSEIR